tara:strand:- start:64 stop:432 length:369 start_codon:yes stop_codon:yes gene_type:complete
MPLQNWSDDIVIAELHDEPHFSEDTDVIKSKLEEDNHFDIILDLSNVTKLNSSNLGALVEIHKKAINKKRKLILSSIQDGAWSVMLVTGLDRVFRFATDVTTALALVQLGDIIPDENDQENG